MGVAVNLTVNRLPRDSENNFTMIPNSILRDSSISLKAKALLMYLIGERDNSHVPVNENDKWVMTIKGLTKAFKESIGSIMRSLKELMKRGYLLRTDVLNDRNLRVRTEYTIFEEPLENADGKPVKVRESELKKAENDVSECMEYETSESDIVIIEEKEVKTEEPAVICDKTFNKAEDSKVKTAENNGFEAEACRTVVKEMVQFDKFSDDFGHDTAKRVVGLVCDTINSDKPVYIGNQRMTAKQAETVLLRLTYRDICEVMTNISEQSNIRNWDKYVLTALYKAAETSPNLAIGQISIAMIEIQELIEAFRGGKIIDWWHKNFAGLRPFSKLAAHSFISEKYNSNRIAFGFLKPLVDDYAMI